MPDEELAELVRRAEAGERLVVRCDSDNEAFDVQTRLEPKLNPVSRRDGALLLPRGGGLFFRSARRCMKQAVMLEEAVKKALAGEQVLVTALDSGRSEAIQRVARASIPNIRVVREKLGHITLAGGGEIRFRSGVGADDPRFKGYVGEVYLVQESGEDWDRGTIPYTPEPAPRSRFERIDDDE